MNTITVDKAELQQTLAKNLAAHTKEYRKAQKKWRKACAKALRKRAEKFEKSGDFEALGMNISGLPKPESYEDDYKRAMSMLSWELEEEVKLNEHDFQRYVLNQWGWSELFAANTQAYTSGKFRGR